MFIKIFFLLINTCIVKLEKNDQLSVQQFINNTEINLQFSNNTFIKESKELSKNYTNTYKQLLKKISNHCISDKEYEEFYHNKLRPGLVSTFFPFLAENAIKQIGLNEIRQVFHLKKQKIKFDGTVEEEFENNNYTDKYKALGYFKREVELYSMDTISNLQFWPEDVQNAEIVLDKIYPEIRQLFKLKYEEIEINKMTFNNQTMDKLITEFILMSNNIFDAIDKSNLYSTSASIFSLFRRFGNCTDPRFIRFN